MISFSGKKVLITGGSRGIGKAAAIMFAKAGADVAIGYLSNDKAANEVISEIEKHSQKGLAIKADMGIRDQVFNMVEEVIKQFGQIDILVNNTGIWEYNPIDDMTDERLQRTIDINLNGCIWACQAVVPYMKKQKSGNIVNISSTAGQRGEAFHSPYSVTKSGLIGLTKSLGVELVKDNIRVNCVAPGWVDTDMSYESLQSDDAASILGKIPMGRVGTPDELAGPILFIASDLATFITGEVLNVNGGAVLCG